MGRYIFCRSKPGAIAVSKFDQWELVYGVDYKQRNAKGGLDITPSTFIPDRYHLNYRLHSGPCLGKHKVMLEAECFTGRWILHRDGYEEDLNVETFEDAIRKVVASLRKQEGYFHYADEYEAWKLKKLLE